MTEMIRRHDMVVDVIRRAMKKNMVERLLSKIGDHTAIREEGLSEEARRLSPDLDFVT
jgi:hypothetical protein